MPTILRALAASLSAAVLSAIAAPVTGQGTWETTLKARDINGNAVALNDASAAFFYDTTLNVTWLADMSVDTTTMFWSQAMAWAAALTTGGFTDWRLPSIIDSGTPGCNFSVGGTDCGLNVETQVGSAYSEWAHLFHVTLGNLSSHDTAGVFRGGIGGVDWGLVNTAYFEDMRSLYWSGTEYAPNASRAWQFTTNVGTQADANKFNTAWAVAVRPGDVLAAVPEPQAMGLALTALAALAVVRRRRAP